MIHHASCTCAAPALPPATICWPWNRPGCMVRGCTRRHGAAGSVIRTTPSPQATRREARPADVPVMGRGSPCLFRLLVRRRPAVMHGVIQRGAAAGGHVDPEFQLVRRLLAGIDAG